MSKGLESFLEKIKKSPQNKTYVDRFLALLINEPSRVRLKLLYKLAVLICRHQTLVALKVSYMALQEARAVKKVRHEIEVLQLIENCFKLLGKKDKVAIIANERENLIATYRQNLKAAQNQEGVQPVPPVFQPNPAKNTAKLPKLPDMQIKNVNNLRIHRHDDIDQTRGRGPQSTDNELGQNMLKPPGGREQAIRPQHSPLKTPQQSSQGEKKYELGEFNRTSGSEPYSKQVLNQFRMKETTVGKRGIDPSSLADDHPPIASDREVKSGKKLLSEALGKQKPAENPGFNESYADAAAFFRDDSDNGEDPRTGSNDFEPVFTAIDRDLPKPARKEFASDQGKASSEPTRAREPQSFADDPTSLLRSSSHFDIAAARMASEDSHSQHETGDRDDNTKGGVRRRIWFIFADRISSNPGSSLEVKLAHYFRQYQISLSSEVFQKFVSRLEIWQRSKSDGTLYEIEALFFTYLGLQEQRQIFVAMNLADDLPTVWYRFLDSLVTNNKARKALMLIEVNARDLTPKDLEWAQQTYAALQKLWPKLAMAGFNWRSSDVAEFTRQLNRRSVPALMAVLC